MTAIAEVNRHAIIDQVVTAGDLSRLPAGERTKYYAEVCRSLGLNPLTKPFEFITLNGKLVLYARKDATDQLRKIHSVSVQIVSRDQIGDVYAVTARATDASGRTDESIGAVSLAGLRGDALCNAIMKAETKAKRRVTLSICGLGILDETELETIPAHARTPEPPPAPNGELAAITINNEPDEEPGNDNLPGEVEPIEEPPTPAPAPRPKGKIGQILALQTFLGWDDAALRRAIFDSLKIAVASEIIPALESLGASELAQIIQLLELERKARIGAQGEKNESDQRQLLDRRASRCVQRLRTRHAVQMDPERDNPRPGCGDPPRRGRPEK
ncbi:MAG: hypothetical protein ACRETN_07610 [Nevskiales bacterium]